MSEEKDDIYFINCFRNYINNTNKEFSRKYTPSIRELFNDYLELHNDSLNSSQNDKLLKSYKAQLIIMDNFIESSIFRKSSFGSDLLNLLVMIRQYKKETDSDNKETKSNTKEWITHSLYSYCTSLQKKICGINLYYEIINIYRASKNYVDFDLCVEAIINELVYDGYSLIYLREWYKNTTPKYKVDDVMDYNSFINEFSNFNKDEQYYDIFLTIKNDDINEISNWAIDYDLCLEFVEKDNLETQICNHLQLNSTNRAIKISIKSMDGYSATFKAVNAINAYLLIVNLTKTDTLSINDKISFLDKISGESTNLNIQSNDAKILFLSLDKKEKNDLEDFIQYRKDIYEKKIRTGEIASIERSLNILKDALSYNQQNRLIELWSVLEYLLSYYSSSSIILKAKDIIPKIMCLYMFKDKLNTFWSLLLSSLNREAIVEEFISQSLYDNNVEKYDIKLIIDNIVSYGEKLTDKFGYNTIILNRKYCELGSIIGAKVDLKKIITSTHQKIEDDIVRIYRTRNIMVHSGNQTKSNILLKNTRLTQYISNLIGVLLHYKRKNNEHTIQEILYSIPVTYENYLNILKQFKDQKDSDLLVEIFKPKYLFL